MSRSQNLGSIAVLISLAFVLANNLSTYGQDSPGPFAAVGLHKRLSTPGALSAQRRVQCQGADRLLFRGLCHEATLGSLELEASSGDLSLSYIDSSGVAEMATRVRGRLGGLRRVFSSSPDVNTPGSQLRWLIQGQFTETRGDTESGLTAGEAWIEIVRNNDTLEVWADMGPLSGAQCERQVEVYENGAHIDSLFYPCGLPLTASGAARLQELEFVTGIPGQPSQPSNVNGLITVFEFSLPFEIPTPEGVRVVTGDKLQIMFTQPEDTSFWVESDRLGVAGNAGSVGPAFSLASTAVLSLGVFNEVLSGHLASGFPSGPLAVQMVRETAFQGFQLEKKRAPWKAEMITALPNVNRVQFQSRPIKLLAGQFFSVMTHPYGSQLRVSRTANGGYRLAAEFPGASVVLAEALRDGAVIASELLENGQALSLRPLANLGWTGWASISDVQAPASLELTAMDQKGQTFQLRFTADIAPSEPIQQALTQMFTVLCRSAACWGAAPSGFVYGKVTWD